MIGCLHAIENLAPRFLEMYYIFLGDSEPVEGAFFKGTSGHTDITSGEGIFWDLCLREDLNHLSRISSDFNPGDAPSLAYVTFLLEGGVEWVDLMQSTEVWEFAKWNVFIDDEQLQCSHKHGLCPPFGFQQAFMWSIAGRRRCST